MAHFVKVTTGDHKLILCGRRTWQGMPGVAQRRLGPRTCVVSRQLDDDRVFDALRATCAYRCDYVADLRKAWGQYSHMGIIGGGEVYRAALEADVVDVIHLSVIHTCEIEVWQREAAGWGSQSWAFRGSPAWEHDVTFPALKWEGWALAETVRHEPDGGARHGWTQLRLVRDPAHPALQDTTKVVGGLPLAWLGMERI
jgi:hypothetical protein